MSVFFSSIMLHPIFSIVTGVRTCSLPISILFCDLPSPIERDGRFLFRASWDGHEFSSLDLAGLSAGAPPPEAAVPPSEGLLHYRYVPRVGAPGEADAQYPVITPYAGDRKSTRLNSSH